MCFILYHIPNSIHLSMAIDFILNYRYIHAIDTHLCLNSRNQALMEIATDQVRAGRLCPRQEAVNGSPVQSSLDLMTSLACEGSASFLNTVQIFGSLICVDNGI